AGLERPHRRRGVLGFLPHGDEHIVLAWLDVERAADSLRLSGRGRRDIPEEAGVEQILRVRWTRRGGLVLLGVGRRRGRGRGRGLAVLRDADIDANRRRGRE